MAAVTATATRAFSPPDRLDVSLQDFEPSIGSPSPRATGGFGYPSAHSGFRSEGALSEMDEDDEDEPVSTASAGGYSPPAWRRLENGDRSSGFWRAGGDTTTTALGGPFHRRNMDGFTKNQALGGYDGRARGMSPVYDSEDEDEVDLDAILQAAIRTRLPTGSMSPEKERSPEPEYAAHRIQNLGEAVKIKEEPEEGIDAMMKTAVLPRPDDSENYFRFAVRAEVQQRTEPIEAAINFVRSHFRSVTKSWLSLLSSAVVAILAVSMWRTLTKPAPQPIGPDFLKAASIARSFEPLIYYSENGVHQVSDLQATGVAVWDLGESVRSSNMTSAPIIVKELDDLSDSLKTLSIELTKFFANVDGDIDGILIVMDWARRELSQLQKIPSPRLTSVFDNIHNMLSAAGLLESAVTGQPTQIGAIATSILGPSTPQRTRQTLQRTFNQFLGTLEEAIDSELQHSLSIFALFEAIDHQFLNLARTVVREHAQQDEEYADLLSSLWTRILGARAADVAKYERNRQLLASVRERTVRNKGVLVEHNHKLLALKANLEALRRRLVSPLVRSQNASTLALADQVRGLEDVAAYLDGVRRHQKGKLMEVLYGSNSRKARRMIEDPGASAAVTAEARWV